MLEVALIGIGRMGIVHANNLFYMRDVKLKYIVDQNVERAQKIASEYQAISCDLNTCLKDPNIAAIFIVSPTKTHADIIVQAAKAGKAIFCEKPIAGTLSDTNWSLEEVQKAQVPLFVGFNRRFDPNFQAIHSRIQKGEIGEIEQIIIISRDPQPPSIDYLKNSGHLFRDMTIHDLDMARWLLNEEPSSLFATGSCLIDQRIQELGDIDQAMIVLQTASGKLCQITNSRRASYGYDQRIEVHGSKGRLSAGNQLKTTVELADNAAISKDLPQFFFLERYEQSYKEEVRIFINALLKNEKMPITFDEGRKAFVLAEAAMESYRSGQMIHLH
jgi:myo-inositol 2-dehydrogenase/D-chiro-inositol 1-dehydrogenase